ncbi:hypothetical protein M0Q97_12320 [Candidatus Dojkabacteria bacterium]|jgi:hypothetical protein|nr:hypothetical protein [Candidatus Dojkabacteria bacterium]
MRTKLKKLDDQRITIFCVFEKFGTKRNFKGFPEETALFVSLKDENDNELCDHIWFTVGKRIKNLNLKSGDKVCFDARIKQYVKGYVNHREYIDERTIDYKLNNPTNFKIL